MAAKATELCTAIVDYLEAESFGYEFAIERRAIMGMLRLEDVIGKQIYVYPSTTSFSAETRTDWRRTVTATVHLLQVMESPESTLEADECLDLMEEIEASLRDTYLGGMSMMQFSSDQSTREVAEAETAASMSTFEAIAEVTFYSHG